jgi:hypothetical protein
MTIAASRQNDDYHGNGHLPFCYSPADSHKNRALCEYFMKIGTVVDLDLLNNMQLGATSILPLNLVLDKGAVLALYYFRLNSVTYSGLDYTS